MRITYDAEVRAAYICLSDALVLTTRRITDDILMDLDADANVVGIEILNVQDAPTLSPATGQPASPRADGPSVDK